MKITANQYAKTLFELINGKSSKEVDEIIFNFVQVVKKNKQAKLFPRIIESFNTIWNEQNKIAEVQVTSSKELDESTKKKIEGYVKKKYEAENVVMTSEINQDIIEGLIVKVGDDLLDTSAIGQLEKLSRILTK
jgi:F-type H+-transporting ATPase subunit delta